MMAKRVRDSNGNPFFAWGFESFSLTKRDAKKDCSG